MRAVLEHARAGLDVDAGDQRHRRAAPVLEREAAREEAAEIEPGAAVEAVAAAQERGIAGNVAARAAQRGGPHGRPARARSPWIARKLHHVFHRHARGEA